VKSAELELEKSKGNSEIQRLLKRRSHKTECWWLRTIILGTCEAKIRRIMV
jgi:hypothetical protein